MEKTSRILPLTCPPLERAFWKDRVVWLSGASGSWGWEFCRQLLDLPIQKLICFVRGEHRAYQLEHYFGDSRIRIHLGDLRDPGRLRESFSAGPDLVIHAAALKRIDSATYSPREFVRTNIDGTWNIIDACLFQGHKGSSVKKAFFVSTDKAFQPETFYGHTKAVAEQLWLLANHYAGETQFLASRFGNALWSTGSVLWTWKEQTEAGVPITLTDPAMTRFILTLREAVSFALNQLERGEPGTLSVPMLPSCTVKKLADAFEGSWPMRVVGAREGGEKLHEGLCVGLWSHTSTPLSPHELTTKVWGAYEELPMPMKRSLAA